MGNRPTSAVRHGSIVGKAGNGRAGDVGAESKALHKTGRVYLEELNVKLSQTQNDNQFLSQELASVRSWMDRLEKSNNELVDQLAAYKANAAALTEDLASKLKLIRTLESSLERSADEMERTSTALDAARIATGRVNDPVLAGTADIRAELQRVSEERDRYMAQLNELSMDDPDAEPSSAVGKTSEELSQLKMELRKKDRALKRQNRNHSKHLRNISVQEVAKNWEMEVENQEKNAAATGDALTFDRDRAVETIMRAQKSSLDRVNRLKQAMDKSNNAAEKGLTQEMTEWEGELKIRRSQYEQLESHCKPGSIAAAPTKPKVPRPVNVKREFQPLSQEDTEILEEVIEDEFRLAPFELEKAEN